MDQTGKPSIICPACKTGRLDLESADEGRVGCVDCNASFPVNNKVVDLLPQAPDKRSPGQVLMEWEPLINIYESKWWRRSSHFGFITGISFADEFDLIEKALELKDDDALLDLACGTGIYSRPFARKLSRGCVTGLDLSAPMLNYASNQARAQGIDNLVLVRGSALEMPFADNEFDVVNCCGAIHLFPDPGRAVSEIGRVLGPGGRLAVAVFRNWLSKRYAAWYMKRSGLHYFHPEDMEAYFKRAGLGEVKVHYARRYWLIMSAKKPK